jgi:Secretion system C-terminal sorting domain
MQAQYFPFIAYNVYNNYWGGSSPEGRLCPEELNYSYIPYLENEIEPPPFCEPLTESANNSSMSQSTLLFGSAIQDEYNGNYSSAVIKYKDLITLFNNPQLSYLPASRILFSSNLDSNADLYALENYYASLANLFPSDTFFVRKSLSFSTAADVEQTSFEEAIAEYQSVINNPINETERHYAYIDQMRTVRLMLDTLLYGPGGDNPFSNSYSNGEFKTLIENVLSSGSEISKTKVNNELKRSKNDKEKTSDEQSNDAIGKAKNLKDSGERNTPLQSFSRIEKNDKLQQLRKLKKSLGLLDIKFEELTNKEKVEVLKKTISYKLYEFSLLNHITGSRPLNRMSNFVKSKTKIENSLPRVFKLYQNYPNPFNPVSLIKFDIPKESNVIVKIYDLLGREVKTLVNETKQSGSYEVLFDGMNYASGVYVYRIEAGNFTDVKKMVLLK